MPYNKYLSIIALSAAFSWIAWLLVIFKLNPYSTMGVSLSFFFLSLLIALSSTFTIIGFYVRVWLFRNEVFYKHISISLRQGILIGILSVFSLVFQMLRVLTWWSGLLLVLVIVLIEFYFSSQDSEFF